MFGYIKVDKTQLNKGELGLYQTFMCGLCMSTKKLFGNIARACVNFDITFFDVLFHSFTNTEVEIYNARCVSSPFRKRTIMKPDTMSDKIAIANIMLVYLNAEDDIYDGGKSLKKRVAENHFRAPYRKAVRLWSALADSLNTNYNELREKEAQGINRFDIICDPFARLSKDFALLTLGEDANEYILDLCYNMGKWIYIIDALDDIQQDLSKNNYNAYISSFGINVGETAQDFVKRNIDEIKFT
ncbi:MAG: DUF5685 family protein, partial [Clostridia bacterium]